MRSFAAACNVKSDLHSQSFLPESYSEVSLSKGGGIPSTLMKPEKSYNLLINSFIHLRRGKKNAAKQTDRNTER